MTTRLLPFAASLLAVALAGCYSPPVEPEADATATAATTPAVRSPSALAELPPAPVAAPPASDKSGDGQMSLF